MRPYKAAIASLCALILVLAGVSGYFLYKQDKALFASNERISQLIKEAIIKDSVNQVKLDSIAKIKNKVYIKQGGVSGTTADPAISKAVAEVKPYVYYVRTDFYVDVNGQRTRVSSSQGTGFLLSDGRFVTARHCVQPWLYNIDKINAMITTASRLGIDYVKGYAIIEAQSMNDRITLRSSDFVVNDAYDRTFETEVDGSPAYVSTAMPLLFNDGTQLGSERMMGNDWAYAKVSKSGGIKANIGLSSTLKAGATVHVLGFPSGLGKADGDREVEPIYNRMSVSRDGLNNSGCIMVSEGVAHGNSGGPVFVLNNGKLEAVAVVSRKESATQQYGMFGIKQQQQQYDHLVPLANLK